VGRPPWKVVRPFRARGKIGRVAFIPGRFPGLTVMSPLQGLKKDRRDQAWGGFLIKTAFSPDGECPVSVAIGRQTSSTVHPEGAAQRIEQAVFAPKGQLNGEPRATPWVCDQPQQIPSPVGASQPGLIVSPFMQGGSPLQGSGENWKGCAHPRALPVVLPLGCPFGAKTVCSTLPRWRRDPPFSSRRKCTA
jgi:hypothetical protein